MMTSLCVTGFKVSNSHMKANYICVKLDSQHSVISLYILVSVLSAILWSQVRNLLNDIQKQFHLSSGVCNYTVIWKHQGRSSMRVSYQLQGLVGGCNSISIYRIAEQRASLRNQVLQQFNALGSRNCVFCFKFASNFKKIKNAISIYSNTRNLKVQLPSSMSSHQIFIKHLLCFKPLASFCKCKDEWHTISEHNSSLTNREKTHVNHYIVNYDRMTHTVLWLCRQEYIKWCLSLQTGMERMVREDLTEIFDEGCWRIFQVGKGMIL